MQFENVAFLLKFYSPNHCLCTVCYLMKKKVIVAINSFAAAVFCFQDSSRQNKKHK